MAVIHANPKANDENQRQWEMLEFSLTQLTQPTVVWMTTRTKLDMRLTYGAFQWKFRRHTHEVLDLSTRQVSSLANILKKELPHLGQKSLKIDFFVHVFGLENSVSPLGKIPLLQAFNHEREQLFREFNCVLVIWSEPAFRLQVRENATDFWDWLELDLEFQSDRPLRSVQSLGWTWQWEWNPYREAANAITQKEKFEKSVITGLIAYAEADADWKRKLEEELLEKADKSIVWKFVKLESLGVEKGDTFTDSQARYGDFLIYLLSANFLEIWHNRSRISKFLGTYAMEYDWLQLRGIHSISKAELFKMFWVLKNQKQHAPLLILLEYCDWKSNNEFEYSPALPENRKPLAEIKIEREEKKAFAELAQVMAMKAEQVRYYYQRTAYREYGSIWFNPEKFDTKSRANRIVFWLVAGVLCYCGYAGFFWFALFFMLIYRQLLLVAVLISVYRALNWHPQLYSPGLFWKIISTPSSMKYLLIKDGFTATVFASDQNWEITQSLTLETSNRFSWLETLAISSVAIFRAAGWASLSIATFHWENWILWLIFLTMLLIHLALRQILGRFVLRKLHSNKPS